jgi:hypothetical protein
MHRYANLWTIPVTRPARLEYSDKISRSDFNSITGQPRIGLGRPRILAIFTSNQSSEQNNMPPPPSRRSSQLTAVASVDPQTPHSSRSIYASHTNTAKVISSRAAQHRHRSSSNSAQADSLSQDSDEESDYGFVSSSGEGYDDLRCEYNEENTLS